MAPQPPPILCVSCQPQCNKATEWSWLARRGLLLDERLGSAGAAEALGGGCQHRVQGSPRGSGVPTAGLAGRQAASRANYRAIAAPGDRYLYTVLSVCAARWNI